MAAMLPSRLSKEQLNEFGVKISTGQINNIIIENKERLHDEINRILSTGLKASGHINVDDTGRGITVKTDTVPTLAMNILPGLKAQTAKAA